MQRVQGRCLECVCTEMWSQLLLLLREVVLRERWGIWFSEMSAQLSAAVGGLSGTPVKQHFMFCSLSFCFININQTSLLSSKTASTHSISPYFLLQNQPANTIPPHPQQTPQVDIWTLHWGRNHPIFAWLWCPIPEHLLVHSRAWTPDYTDLAEWLS